MQNEQTLSQYVESFKFWDVVTLWAKERLEHEEIVARVLAAGIIREGLIIQSRDSRWMEVGSGSGKEELKGYPYVGYCAEPGGPMAILRASALEHLLAIVNRAEMPDRNKLGDEYITREDFRSWMIKKNETLPSFWYST